MAEDYRQQYNKHRPHSSLGHMTPDEFTLDWHRSNPRILTSTGSLTGGRSLPLRQLVNRNTVIHEDVNRTHGCWHHVPIFRGLACGCLGGVA